MQGKKRDTSKSPIKYNNEPDFQSKKKYDNMSKNQITNKVFQNTKDNINNEILNTNDNYESLSSGLRKSRSSYNIGRNRKHINMKNIASMPSAGCATNIPNYSEYVLLDNKVPYKLKTSNFPMSNSAIQNLYQPVFANESDYIVLKNNIPYHLKKHSTLISKNDETGDWWVNNYDTTNSYPSQNHDNKNNIYNNENHFPSSSINKENMPKYRRSHSQNDLNYQRRFYKDEDQRRDQEFDNKTNNNISHLKNHATQTEKNSNGDSVSNHKPPPKIDLSSNNLKKKVHSDEGKNDASKTQNKDDDNVNFVSNNEPTPRIEVSSLNVRKKMDFPESKNDILIPGNKIKVNDKKLLATKSAVANYVAQKHAERKKKKVPTATLR